MLKDFIKQIYPSIKTKQCLVTFCSTFAVALALILVIAKNTSVKASVSNSAPMATLENDVENDGFEEETIISEKEAERHPIPHDGKYTIEVKSGDTLLNILTDMGVEYKHANDLFVSIRKVFDPRDLRVGQKIEIETATIDGSYVVKSLASTLKTGQHLNVTINDDNTYSARVDKDELIEEVKTVYGQINGTVSASMHNNGVPSRIVANFIHIFSAGVDFRRDIKKDDTYEIMYKNYLLPDGSIAKNGNIIYASITLGKNKMELYRFKDAGGNVDYYTSKGAAIKKNLLSRRPMAHQSSRISSHFGRRRHPIYKDIRTHWGVDYPAPKGSAIYAAGDGVVEVAKYRSGYGNYIRIRHNGEYSTAYGHMNGYARGVKAGTRVKKGQTIGYVGSTGRSTGPHLHYEVIRNGQRVNPLTIKATAANNLTGKNLTNFKHQVSKIDETRKNMLSDVQKSEKLAQEQTAQSEKVN